MARQQRDSESRASPSAEIADPRKRTADTDALITAVSRMLVGADEFSPVAWRSSPELEGIAGQDLPARVGGQDLPATEMAELFRRCGRLDMELRDTAGAGHARLLSQVRTRRFDPLLRDVARGAAYCAVAITEPETGSDLHALKTRATPCENGYRLDGVKQHIARIKECTHLIVLAAVHRPAARITAFVVPADSPGVKIEPMEPMGMATISWGRVRLEDVTVPAENRVGGEGEGISLFLRHFSYWRIMMAAAGSAVPRRASMRQSSG